MERNRELFPKQGVAYNKRFRSKGRAFDGSILSSKEATVVLNSREAAASANEYSDCRAISECFRI